MELSTKDLRKEWPNVTTANDAKIHTCNYMPRIGKSKVVGANSDALSFVGLERTSKYNNNNSNKRAEQNKSSHLGQLTSDFFFLFLELTPCLQHSWPQVCIIKEVVIDTKWIRFSVPLLLNY